MYRNWAPIWLETCKWRTLTTMHARANIYSENLAWGDLRIWGTFFGGKAENQFDVQIGGTFFRRTGTYT